MLEGGPRCSDLQVPGQPGHVLRDVRVDHLALLIQLGRSRTRLTKLLQLFGFLELLARHTLACNRYMHQ